MLGIDKCSRTAEQLDNSDLLEFGHLKEVGNMSSRHDDHVATAQRGPFGLRVCQFILHHDGVGHAQLTRLTIFRRSGGVKLHVCPFDDVVPPDKIRQDQVSRAAPRLRGKLPPVSAEPVERRWFRTAGRAIFAACCDNV